jgi:hypothetical protein
MTYKLTALLDHQVAAVARLPRTVSPQANRSFNVELAVRVDRKVVEAFVKKICSMSLLWSGGAIWVREDTFQGPCR